MTNLTNLAMLGDRKAQEEITARGELLPCPFCGGTVLKVIIDVPDNWVECVECGCSGRVSNGIKAAKAMWNTRPKLVTSCWECNSYYEDGTCSQRQTWERLKAIEDIFGDYYDLDFLLELIRRTEK